MQLTEADIKSIITSGEGYNAEFKIRVPTKVKELAEEVCSFANAAGGVVLLGIDDKNKIQGVVVVKKKRSAIQNAIDQLNPHLFCPFYLIEIEGKQIGVIEVPSGTQKPYTLSGAIYVRQGPNSQKITSVEQMRDFFQQADRIYLDEAICRMFSYGDDFSIDFFKEFRLNAGFSSAVDNSQIIKNLKLIDDDGLFKKGSVLFFGKSPENFFDKAVVRCIAFEGTVKTQIIDDKIWGGPLIYQYRQAMQWIKAKLNVRYKIEGGGPREEIWEIPETAFREAIINSLTHRDYYDKGGRITIEVFDDRVEITNPGGLVSAISPSEFGTKSHSRNPLIFGLFERIDMVEQIGSGISRIKEEMEKAKLPVPVFKTDGIFTIVLKRYAEKGSEISSEKVLKLIKE